MAELIPPSAVHESSVHALTGSADADRFSVYMFELIMDEAWEIKEYSLPYGVFLTQFLISRGVVIAASDTRKEVKSALNKFTLSRSRGQEGALTRRFARRAAAAVGGITAFDISVRGTYGDGSTCSASSMGGPAICGLRQPCRRDYEGHSTAC
ncbi:hypothetical protein CJ030_MR7G020471 [Morella rubra]|uniref:Uncharacterized protein n=1 Tax=Morella rubra TaxID=262757 RepID=A0A6A1V2X9_9ROSI|nr:hypothetical protein CJ030_MR7G020471 [Morella rubra]